MTGPAPRADVTKTVIQCVELSYPTVDRDGIGTREDTAAARQFLQHLDAAARTVGGYGALFLIGDGDATLVVLGPDAEALLGAVEPVVAAHAPARPVLALVRHARWPSPDVHERLVTF